MVFKKTGLREYHGMMGWSAAGIFVITFRIGGLANKGEQMENLQMFANKHVSWIIVGANAIGFRAKNV